MNQNASVSTFSSSFARYVENGGWCSSAFLGVCIAMVEFWNKRGVVTKFGRAGLLSTLDGKAMAIATTGYTPPRRFNWPPMDDRSHNYVHMLSPDGTPQARAHCSEQEKLVEWFEQLYSDLLEKQPYTPEERAAMDKAIAAGNSGWKKPVTENEGAGSPCSDHLGSGQVRVGSST